MAALRDFNIGRLKADFGLRYLVELGTGDGDGVEFVKDLGFEHVHSVESQHKPALKVALRHSQRQDITIIHARTSRGLLEALEEIPADAPTLFWIDSCYSGCDTRQLFDVPERTGGVPLRIERDLRQILAARSQGADIIMMDDLFLYDDDAYQGPFPENPPNIPPQYRSVAFMEPLLSKSHRLEVIMSGGGTLVALPLHPKTA